ncbi:MAG: DUF4037 domain-containing protein, partial [Clostridia bacterium]|nr:DUF4037 domain-containing protein [Clostridia bacterium]
MKGIEISEKFYNEYGAALLDGEFKDIKDKIAVGLFGSGSECFGFDDDTSRDHDFDAGFIIVLPSEAEVDEKRAFALERAYSKLPDEFMGLKRSKINPVGGNRRGVIRAERFFTEKVGRADGLIEGDEWFSVPESFLAEAVNGKVFFDGSGVFSGVRDYLSSYPKAVFLKKLAGNILLAGQAGQYNYARCLTRGNAEAQMCVYEFVDKAMNAAFLLGGVYRPYYKWAFKALSQVEG